MLRVTIGQFARVTGLTARALRLYDREGLLRPSLVDPETGYRYYRYDQAVQAERIRLLRSLGVPLEEIKQILAEADPRALRAHIAEHRQRIEALIVHYRQTVEALELLAQHEGLPYHPEVKELSAQPFVYRRYNITLATIDETRARAQEALRAYLRKQGVPPSGPVFSSGPNHVADRMLELSASADTPPQQTFDDQMMPLLFTKSVTTVFTLEIGQPVAYPVPPGDGFGSGVWPGGRCVRVVHLGPHSGLLLAHRAAVLYALEHGEKPQGRNRELFFAGPWDTGDTSHFHTEVQYQLA